MSESVAIREAYVLEPPLDGRMMVLRVLDKTVIAEGIILFSFGCEDGGELPPFTAGSHVLVQTPSGQVRRYSLCNSPSERARYLIAVKREVAGSGGSISMADDVRCGDRIAVSTPANCFALSDTAKSHLLIAGGIGITPILAMARYLEERSGDYRVIYLARSQDVAAFHDVLSSRRFASRATIHFDYGMREKSFDLADILADRSTDTHAYCCGPRALMNEVRERTRHWPRGTVHFEDFGTGAQARQDGERAFRVRLARSRTVVEVPAGCTILEALKVHGLDAPSSCESGTCGTCRTKLLAGVAEHRDYVLDDSEHRTDIMICVSRAVSDELTIDL